MQSTIFCLLPRPKPLSWSASTLVRYILCPTLCLTLCGLLQGCSNSYLLSAAKANKEQLSILSVSVEEAEPTYSLPNMLSHQSITSTPQRLEGYHSMIPEESRHRVSEDDFIDSLFPSLWVCHFGRDDDLHLYAPPLQLSSNSGNGPEDLWQVIREGFQLDLSLDNKSIASQFNWYTQHQRYLDRVTQRASRYLYYVVQQIEERDMPMELALLPIVESAYDPFAYSHGRASGIWQFIPSTGKHFGLKQDWWYDGRRDIVASTDAALNYLSMLHKQFDNDWLLALAAYNAGQGNVRRAIRRNKKLSKPTDFWSLKLPRETRHYAPKLLALAKLVASPEKYNMRLKPVANRPYFAKVDTQSQIDLAQAATLAQINIEEIYKLNPGFNRWATAPNGPFHLLVPIGNADIFAQGISTLPAGERLGWKRYKIRSGDALSKIARRHHTSVDVLQKVNRIRSNKIRAGDQLLIPVATQSSQHYSLSIDERIKKIQHSTNGKKGAKRIVHTVRPGESFWSISRQYGVKVKSIARWNGVAPRDILKPKQKLTIWVRSSPSNNIIAPTDTNQVIRKVGYKVRRGDSLARIANKFKVRIADIVRWNMLDAKRYLQPGQGITLYLDVTEVN